MMTTDKRLTSLPDPTHALALVLPPLQDPTPSRAAGRPLPLEPNASTDAHADTAQLGSHGRKPGKAGSKDGDNNGDRSRKSRPLERGEQKQAGQGVPGSEKSSRAASPLPLQTSSTEELSRCEARGPRARRRVQETVQTQTDFVQLPQPHKKQAPVQFTEVP